MDSGSNSGNVVAKVNGTAISQDQLKATYNRLREQQQMQLGAGFVLTDAVQQKLRQAALEQLVSTQALSAAALKEDLRFSPSQVGQVIAGISAFQEEGHFSPNRFVQAIASLGFTEQGFYADVRNAMLINQMRVGLVGSNFALPFEVHNALNLINQKRDIQYLTLTSHAYESKVTVSDQQINEYYQQHQNQYQTPARVALQYLHLSTQELQAKQAVQPADVEAFYQENISNYTLPAKWQLQTVFLAANASTGHASMRTMQAVVDHLKHSQSLAEIKALDANLQVQDSYWLSSKEADPAILSVLNHLNAGQVSTPIKTTQGLVVVKLIAQQKAQVQSLAQVKEQVTQDLKQQKAAQAFAEQSKNLDQLTYTHPDSLTAAARALGLTINTTPLLADNAQGPDLWNNSAVKQAAFSKDVLAGNNSAVLAINDHEVVVLRVLKQEPAAVLALSQVKSSIKALLQQQQAQAMAEADAKQLVAAIQQHQSVEALMRQHHWQWTQAKAVGRYSASVNGAIVGAAFQLARPSQKPSVNAFRLPKGDWAVVQLLNISEAKDAAMTAIQQRVMAQQIASGYAQLDYQLYVSGVMSKAHVVINQPAKTDEQ